MGTEHRPADGACCGVTEWQLTARQGDWAGEMAPLTKGLPCKCKAFSSICRTHMKKPGADVQSYSPSAGAVEKADP